MKDFEKDLIIRDFLKERVKASSPAQKEAKDILWGNIERKKNSTIWLKRSAIGVCLLAACAAILFSVFGTYKRAHNPNIAEILTEISDMQSDESDDAALYQEWEELGEFVELQREKDF